MNNAPYVPNYLAQAILVTIFCCLPFGIPAIVFAAQVNGKLTAGDYEGAKESSRKAKTWTWVAFGVGLGFMLIWVIFYVVLGFGLFFSGGEYNMNNNF